MTNTADAQPVTADDAEFAALNEYMSLIQRGETDHDLALESAAETAGLKAEIRVLDTAEDMLAYLDERALKAGLIAPCVNPYCTTDNGQPATVDRRKKASGACCKACMSYKCNRPECVAKAKENGWQHYTHRWGTQIAEDHDPNKQPQTPQRKPAPVPVAVDSRNSDNYVSDSPWKRLKPAPQVTHSEDSPAHRLGRGSYRARTRAENEVDKIIFYYTDYIARYDDYNGKDAGLWEHAVREYLHACFSMPNVTRHDKIKEIIAMNDGGLNQQVFMDIFYDMKREAESRKETTQLVQEEKRAAEMADQQSFNTNAFTAEQAAQSVGVTKGGPFAGGISNPATPEQIEAAKAAVAPIVAKLPEQAAAMAAKEDEKPAAPPSVLDNAFPRENGQPVEEVPADHVMGNLDPEPEPPAKNAKHWMDNPSKRGKFFATITELFEKAGIYKGDIEKAAEHAIDVIQLHDAPSLSESIDLCEVYAGVVASVQANIEKFEKMYDVKNLLGIAYPQFPNVDRALRLGEFLRPIDLWESIKIKGLLEVEKRKPPAPQTPETAPNLNEPSAKAIETPARPELAIVARDVVSAESPVVVYPSEKGEVISGGIRYSVTMRAGATAEMAINAIHEWDRFWQLAKASGIAHVSEVRQVSVPTQPPAPVIPFPNQPMNNPPQPSAPASTNGGTPDKKGRVSGQKGSTQIAYVQRKNTDGKESYELWTAQGQYSDYRLRRESDVNMLRAIMPFPLETMQYGSKYPVSLVAEWVVTGNLSKQGTYYVDVTALRNV